jgi:hypothetical protein
LHFRAEEIAMEIRDGFIDGIHNYCDRWCETCAFTTWCRLFADSARDDATHDPNLKPVVDAPPLPHEVGTEPPPWMQELVAEVESAVLGTVGGDAEAPSRRPRRDDHVLLDRARAYSLNVHRWMAAQHDVERGDPGDPRAVISWFASMIPAKIGRALSSRAYADPDDPDCPRDHDGSAKVALIGIERSHAAWLRQADAGSSAVTFISDLVWIGEAVEREFPAARSFVRPAFDEPEAVARLRASGGWR